MSYKTLFLLKKNVIKNVISSKKIQIDSNFQFFVSDFPNVLV